MKSNALNCGQLSQSEKKSSERRLSNPVPVEFDVMGSNARLSDSGVKSDFVLSLVVRAARCFIATLLVKPCIMRWRLLISLAEAVKMQPLFMASSVPALALNDSSRLAHSLKRIICTSMRWCRPPAMSSALGLRTGKESLLTPAFQPRGFTFDDVFARKEDERRYRAG